MEVTPVFSFIKNQIKKIGASAVTAAVLGRLLYWYAYFVYLTNQFDYVGWPEKERLEGKAFFVTFWHGHLLAPPFLGFRFYKPKKSSDKRWYLLASMHRDGRIVAETAHCFGGEVIDGSAKKGGVAAGLAINRLMESSSILFMAPDGRKPGYKLTKGIVRLASQTGKPVYLCAFSTSRGFRFNTWDKFFFPLPFGKGVVMCDEAVFIPPALTPEDIAQWQDVLEKKLLALTARAEAYVGREVSAFLTQTEEEKK